jgi:hypothetical protein
MNVNDSTLKTKHALTHNEAQLVLGVMDPDKLDSEMSKNEIKAVEHYVNCEECQTDGLAKLLGLTLSCKDAVLIWAQNPGHLNLYAQTLRQKLAAEHVWGRGRLEENFCQNHPCQLLRHHFMTAKGCSSVPPGGINDLFPFLIDIFRHEGWPLNELFTIQEERVHELLRSIKSGKVDVSEGYYFSADELMEEIERHVRCLQQFALEMYK